MIINRPLVCKEVLKFQQMILTPLIEFQYLQPTNIPKYFNTTKVAEFLNETIGKGRTNKETAEL